MGSVNPAVIAIDGYQRYISPYKGFCCAHRVLTGEDSCSEFAKQAILARGFFGSIKAIWRRLEVSVLRAISTRRKPKRGGKAKRKKVRAKRAQLPMRWPVRRCHAAR